MSTEQQGFEERGSLACAAQAEHRATPRSAAAEAEGSAGVSPARLRGNTE
jgi:hypothetical protein